MRFPFIPYCFKCTFPLMHFISIFKWLKKTLLNFKQFVPVTPDSMLIKLELYLCQLTKEIIPVVLADGEVLVEEKHTADILLKDHRAELQAIYETYFSLQSLTQSCTTTLSLSRL